MSKKSRANKEKAQTTETVATVEATPVVRVDSGTYVDLLPQGYKLELQSLIATKGIRAKIQTTTSESDYKRAQDSNCALVIAVESIYRKLDNNLPPVASKRDCMRVIGEKTGYMGKYIPENSLYQGLNRLGGNDSKTSLDKTGEKDLWATTPRVDGKRVLINSHPLTTEKEGIFLLPELWATGYYERPTPEALKVACDWAIRKELVKYGLKSE